MEENRSKGMAGVGGCEGEAGAIWCEQRISKGEKRTNEKFWICGELKWTKKLWIRIDAHTRTKSVL